MGAAQAVGALGGDAAIPHIAGAFRVAVGALDDERFRVRLEAAAAIGRLHGALTEPAELAAKVASEALRGGTGAAEGGGGAGMVTGAEGPTSALRAEAGKALRALGPDVESLGFEVMEMLAHGSSEVRNAASEALAEMGSSGIGHLGVALRHQNWRVRLAAANALKARGFEDAHSYVSVTALRDN
mmetsp:Transcript_158082/g.507166  ORF Transcript_158082/g.507166 Transcript_158082/m.507166 type:complete len:185 (+) Transcript_158082:80-634(+)